MSEAKNNSNTTPSSSSSKQEPKDLLEHIPIGHPDSMMSKESVRRAVEDFQIKETDVIVATFPKTGTTLVTWICHLLRSGANQEQSFGSIQETLYEVVPWPLLSWDIGYDPNAPSDYVPRIFKSHLRMASVYPGCKYVVTIRDPAKTVLSFYNFFIAKRVPFLVDSSNDDNNSQRLLMDLSTFLLETPFVRGSPKTETTDLRASIWEYYAEYHKLLECPSVLMLIYEDLVDPSTKKESVSALCSFLGVSPDPQLLERTLAMSTKEFMAQHMSIFDEPYERAKALNRAADVSQLAPGAKVALKAHTQEFNESALQFLKESWKAHMEPLGYKDYGSFCETIRRKQNHWYL